MDETIKSLIINGIGIDNITVTINSIPWLKLKTKKISLNINREQIKKIKKESFLSFSIFDDNLFSGNSETIIVNRLRINKITIGICILLKKGMK